MSQVAAKASSPIRYAVFGLSLGSSLNGEGAGLGYRGWHSASVRGLSQASLSNVKAIKATSSVRSRRASGSGGAATTHLTSTPKDTRPDPTRLCWPCWALSRGAGAKPHRPSSRWKASSVTLAALQAAWTSSSGCLASLWCQARQRSSHWVMGLHADPLGQPGDTCSPQPAPLPLDPSL